ncbi:MAG: hypothetical protein FJY53_03025 [Betaproteobacteria bacterium]|nr:hypothetical protein [Betaproteobacteria bacterium]
MLLGKENGLLKWLRLKHRVVLFILLILAVLSLLFSSGVTGSSSSLDPTVEQVGDITYISGGVSESESVMMKALAVDYQLEIVLIQKLQQREEYLADVNVQVFDHNLKSLLNIDTEGPYLLMNLPLGKYLITAEYEGVAKSQWVKNDGKKHQKLIYWWPISETLP